MNGSGLAKKLLLKAGPALVLEPPPGFLAQLGEAAGELHTAPQAGEPYDFVLLFARDQAGLARLAPLALQALRYDGLLWIAYPKRSSKTITDLSRDAGWEVLWQAGLQGIAVVSIDATWSALRFRPTERIQRQENRPGQG
ncbi:MAG: hypothetical protein GYA17_02905 [Chloroflexi bacterium]|jgi:hypothetical protein|nr:hypothetical protein [Anaerolineaceae bacterium]NMB87280.1 hypothetical protein [Chloroflexota bacterium]